MEDNSENRVCGTCIFFNRKNNKCALLDMSTHDMAIACKDYEKSHLQIDKVNTVDRHCKDCNYFRESDGINTVGKCFLTKKTKYRDETCSSYITRNEKVNTTNDKVKKIKNSTDMVVADTVIITGNASGTINAKNVVIFNSEVSGIVHADNYLNQDINKFDDPDGYNMVQNITKKLKDM